MDVTGNPNMTALMDRCSPEVRPGVHPTIITAAAIQGIITGIGLLGNALVIFVLILARDRQDTSSVIYVLNLAIADFLFLAVVPFQIAQRLTLKWTTGGFMCKFAGGFLIYLNFFVSPLFLMVMSIDRYLAVNRAVSSANLRATKSSRLVSIVVWIVAVVVILPAAMFHTINSMGVCKIEFPGDRPNLDQMDTICINEYIANALRQTETVTVTPGEYFGMSRNHIGSMELTTHPTSESSRKQNQEEGLLGVDDRNLAHTSVPLLEATTVDHNLNTTILAISSSRSTTAAVKSSTLAEKWNWSSVDISNASCELVLEAEVACMPPMPTLQSNVNIIYECNYRSEPFSHKLWVVLNFFISYFIPTSVIVICYMAILRKLYRPSRVVHTHSRGKARRQAMRKKVTLMVAMLVVSYFICFTPYYIWTLMRLPGIVVSSTHVCHHVTRFNNTMAYLNSAVNPILYTFLGDQFAAKFKLAWRRIARKTEYRFGAVLTVGHRNRATTRRTAHRASDPLAVNEETPRENAGFEVKEDKSLVSANNNKSKSRDSQRPRIAKMNIAENVLSKTNNGSPVISKGCTTRSSVLKIRVAKFFSSLVCRSKSRESVSKQRKDKCFSAYNI